MVKKALNNPLVVGVLVLLALAFVLRDVLHFSDMLGGGSERETSQARGAAPQQAGMTPAPVAAPAAAAHTVKSTVRAALAHTDWQRVSMVAMPNRDPFAPLSVSSPALSAVGRATDTPDEVVIPDLVLQAIVSAQGTHYASISGHVMRIGDMVEGWKLVAVGIHRVQMRGPGGLLTLDIDGGARLGGKALARRVSGSRDSSGGRIPAASGVPQSEGMGEMKMYRELLDRLIRDGVFSSIPGEQR